MLDLFLCLFGAGIAAAILDALFRPLWISFKWRVLGMMPVTVNEELIDITVEHAAKAQFDMEIADMESMGYEFATERKEEYRTTRTAFLKSVIMKYLHDLAITR